jgi:hypothetical protein
MTKTDLIETIARMNNEQQTRFYDNLRADGLSEDEILAIQGMVFFTKLYSSPELYREVRDEMGRQLYEEFTR